MNSKTPTPFSDTDSVDDSNQAASRDVLVNDRLARRRLLLSTVTGSAVLLSASPIKALAQTCSTQQCSISGMKSANHSFKPGECAEPCGGYSPGYWGQVDLQCANSKNGNNGKGGGNSSECTKVPRNTWPYANYNDPFNKVFTSSSCEIPLFELMWNSSYSSTAETHWVCAWLNARAFEQGRGPKSYVFPYSTQEVLDFYAGTHKSGYSRQEALDFFKYHTEDINKSIEYS